MGLNDFLNFELEKLNNGTNKLCKYNIYNTTLNNTTNIIFVGKNKKYFDINERPHYIKFIYFLF